MANRQETQKNFILNQLKNGKKVTPMQALNDCQCWRLADVIFKLRNEGYNIKTHQVIEDDKRYAKYELVEGLLITA